MKFVINIGMMLSTSSGRGIWKIVLKNSMQDRNIINGTSAENKGQQYGKVK